MAKISFMGMSTGLPPNLVDQLVEAERIPVKNMEVQKGKQESRLKLVNELEGKLTAITGTLGSLTSSKGFRDVRVNSGDPNIIQGAVDPGAGVTGSWNIEVIELAEKAAAITNGFPDKDTTKIGVGYFRFNTPEGRREVYINGESNTLQGAANAINAADIGVRASIINDRANPDAPFKLVLAGETVGGDSQVSYPTLYFLDGDQDIYFDDSRKAKNGRVKIDGFEFEVSDNKVDDVIPGVSLELRQAAPGRNVNISVKEDMEVVTGKIKSFVDSLNEVFAFIQKQNSLNKDSDTSSTLGGDGLLRTIENRLRRLIQDPQYGLGTEINRIAQLGVQFNRNGTLDFSEDQFNQSLLRDPSAVQRFLAGDGFSTGFIPKIRREVGNIMNSAFGPLAVRKRALQDRIGQMDDRIAAKERQLVVKEDSLRRKFAKLEEMTSRLKSQGSALSGFGQGVGGGQ